MNLLTKSVILSVVFNSLQYSAADKASENCDDTGLKKKKVADGCYFARYDNRAEAEDKTKACCLQYYRSCSKIKSVSRSEDMFRTVITFIDISFIY